MQIYGTAHHHNFICIEYQHFRDVLCSIVGSVYNQDVQTSSLASPPVPENTRHLSSTLCPITNLWKLPDCSFLPIIPSVRHQTTPNIKHFRRPHRCIRFINFMNIDWGIRPYGANKFAKFGIFEVFCVRNPRIWTDTPEIWQDVGDCCFPPLYQIWWQSVLRVAHVRRKTAKSPRE